MSFESDDPADVIDAQDARLEIYIRMNDDPEKDYCFSVGINDTFESLLKVFEVLKLSLRPSVFYEHIPSGFQVSVDPGYLTDGGAVLYSDSASKVTKDVKLTDKISDFAWPGQLILPVWKTDKTTKYSITFALLAWLYTDLPDYISPTPGICLTNQFSRLLAFILEYFELHDLASDILGETVPHKTKLTAQIIFFIFHLLKVAFIYLVFWSGLMNPYSLNPHKIYQVNKTDKLDESKREQLISIGWTGSRKASLEEYRDYLRDSEVKRYGSLVKASKNGLFEKLKAPAIRLEKGEGYDSDIQNKSTFADLEKNPEKYILNYEIFGEIGDHFETYLGRESTDINADIKNFRKYGALKTSKRLSEIIAKRRAFGVEQAAIASAAKKDGTSKKNE